MYEIEMKFKVQDLDFDEMLERFNFSGTIKEQDDFIFVPTKNIYKEKTEAGDRIYRLRKEKTSEGEKSIITLKIQGGNQLSSREIEFEVSDSAEALEFLKNSDLVQSVNVNKKRAEFKKDGYNFCIDVVEKLGVFIELEKISDNKNSKIIQKDMKKYLQNLGVNGEICEIPYDTQIQSLGKNYK